MLIKLFKTANPCFTRKLLFFPVLFLYKSLFGQIDYLHFDKLNNNLSTNIVNAIYQDSKGWMWFSTSQGLNRYDGVPVNDDNGNFWLSFNHATF